MLSHEQLKQLVRFIHKRGFREPAVVLEILDHFACKVEELLAAKPGMDFQQAMMEAHKSFGVRGFYPFSEDFYRHTQRKYKKLFWKNLGAVLSKPVSIMALPVIGYVVYNLYMQATAQFNFRLWDAWNVVDFAFLLLMIICSALDIITMYRLPKTDRKHPFILSSLLNGSVSGLTLYIILPGIFKEPNTEYSWVMGLIFSVYIAYIIPRHIAVRKTIAKALDDLEVVKKMAIDA